MSINKVQDVYGNVLLDVSGDTVTEDDVSEGVTFHDNTGTARTGAFNASVILRVLNIQNGNEAGSLVQKQGGAVSSSGSPETQSMAEGINAAAFGSGNNANGDNSIVAGRKSNSYQNCGFAFGAACIVGDGDKAAQLAAILAELKQAYPQNLGETDEAYTKRIYGYLTSEEKKLVYSFGFAANSGSKALGYNSTAFCGGTASGEGSFAAGVYTEASGRNSLALGAGVARLGVQGTVTASGNAAAALNANTEAEGAYSLATGFGTIARGTEAFAAGLDTLASGEKSFAAGQDTVAEGKRSVTFGYKTVAKNNDQFVRGRANEEESEEFVDIVGWGDLNEETSSVRRRKTIYKLDKNGNIHLPILGAGITLTSPNGTKYKLTVSDDGKLTIQVY